DVVAHPYPVTPFHGDYLHHVDVVDRVKAQLLAEAQTAPAVHDLMVRANAPAKHRLRDDPPPDGSWDVEIQEIAASDLVASAVTSLNGWTGPPALRTGWFQAYLALQDGIDPGATDRFDRNAARLQSGEIADPVERINAERALVADLVGGCRQGVVG